MAKIITLKINGQEVAHTFNAMNKEAKKLRAELSRLRPGTEEFVNTAKKLSVAEQNLKNIREEMYKFRQETQKGSSVFSQFVKGFLAVDLFRFFSGKASQSITQMLELSDQMTAVSKTTQLAQKQVEELWQQFEKVDTRTSRMELLKISELAGRLGIQGKENVAEFTVEIDKAYVALGDSFSGGLEAVAMQLGKIKNIFEQTQVLGYGEAIHKIGSALNELGANGTASEENISDFALRIGQLPNALKPSIDAVLGLGAAFEESGIDARIAGSGFSNFISAASVNLDAFAKQMKMPIEKAKELLNTKPEQFFLKFAASMKGLDAQGLAKRLEALKLNTLEVRKAVGSASGAVDRFQNTIELSKNAMQEGISLQNEFNAVNNNTAAVWQKIKNEINDFFISSNTYGAFNKLTKVIAHLIGITKEAKEQGFSLAQRLKFAAKILVVLTSTYYAHIAAVKLYTLWKQRAAMARLASYKAQKLLNAVINKNIYATIIAAIVGMVAAYKMWNTQQDKAVEKQKSLNRIKSNIKAAMHDELTKMKQLLVVAQNENVQKQQRIAAIKKLNELSPKYLGNLTLENIKTQQATSAINNYIKALEKKAKAEVLNDELKTLYEQRREIEKEQVTNVKHSAFEKQLYNHPTKQDAINAVQEQYNNDLIRYSNSPQAIQQAAYAYQQRLKTIDQLYKKKMEKLYEQDEKIAQLSKEIEKMIVENPSVVTENNITENTSDNTPENKKLNNRRNERDNAEQELQKWKQKTQEIEKEKREFNLELIEQTHQKELQKLKEQQAEKQQTLSNELQEYQKQQRFLNEKLQELNEKLYSQENSEEGKQNILSAIEHTKQTQQEVENLMQSHNQRIQAMQQAHQHQLEQMNLKHQTEKLKKLKEEHENQLQLKRIEALTLIEIENIKGKERQKRIETIEKEILFQRIDFIRTHFKDLKQAISDGYFNDLKLTDKIFSEQDAQELKTRLIATGADIKDVYTIIAQLKQTNTNTQGANHSMIENTDIFGQTASQWEQLFNNTDNWKGKMEATVATVQAMQQVWGQYHDFQMRKEQEALQRFEKGMQRKKEALKTQLEQGYINQKQYDEKVKQIDEDVDKRRQEFQLKQAKYEKSNAIISSIIQTALAISATIGKTGVFGIPLVPVVAALGAAQTAMIAAQPLPTGYFEGGETKSLGFKDPQGHEVAGIVHANEYVIPQWLRRKPAVARIEQWLEDQRTGKNTSFYKGGYTSLPTYTHLSDTPEKENSFPVVQEKLMGLLLRNAEILEKIELNGVNAYIVSDEHNGKKIQQTLRLYEKYKQHQQQF